VWLGQSSSWLAGTPGRLPGEIRSEKGSDCLASGMEGTPRRPEPAARRPPHATPRPWHSSSKPRPRPDRTPSPTLARLFRSRTLIALLTRLRKPFPFSTGLIASRNEALAVEAKIALAEAAEATGNPDRAAGLLQGSGSPTRVATTLRIARCFCSEVFARGTGKKEEAKRAYDELLTAIPAKPFAADARQRTAGIDGEAR